MLKRKSKAKKAPAAPAAGKVTLPQTGKVVAISFGDHSRTYNTQVEESAGRRLVIVAPMRRLGPPIRPEPGVEVLVGWPTALGYWEAEATLERTEFESMVTWVLEVSSTQRRQRRSAFRLSASLPVRLHLGEDGIETRTRDVSEGGLGCEVTLAQAPDEGEQVGVTLTMPDGQELFAAARVVRRQEFDVTRCAIGLSFVEEDEERGEVLRQYVFEEQLRQRSPAR